MWKTFSKVFHIISKQLKFSYGGKYVYSDVNEVDDISFFLENACYPAPNDIVKRLGYGLCYYQPLNLISEEF